VLFDFDGTLRFDIPRSVDAFHEQAKAEGVAVSPEDRRAAWRWIHSYWAGSEDLKADLAAAGDDREAEFWRLHTLRHLQVLGVPEDRRRDLAERLVRRMREEHNPEDIVPEDVPVTLAKLQRAGCKLGLVSNRQEPLHELAAELQIADFFHLILAAGEVDKWKPDPSLLLHAVEMMGSDPDYTIYVGDNPYADVAAAKAAGMQAVLVDPEGFFPEADCITIDAIGELPDLLSCA
jgi:HAD superfamily hydrolase (TIGR01662 family)